MVKYLATEVRWQDRRFNVPLERIKLSEELGYDAVFTAEGWGTDALTPLGYIAAHTKKLMLGTRILQITGRQPTTAARALMTLHHMTGRRIIGGLGNSNAFISEGLMGIPWSSPVERMRDYVHIMRKAISGQPLDYQGKALSVPYPGGTTEPFTMPLEPTDQISLIVSASGPAVMRVAAEVGDGFMPSFHQPGLMGMLTPHLEEGFRRSGASPERRKNFEIWGHVDTFVGDDVRATMRPLKEYVARHIDMKLEHEVLAARGFPEVAPRVEELMAADRVDEAIDAVPDEYVDGGWLVGPLERIRERVKPWLDCDLTGLIIRYGPQVGDDRSGVPENLDAFRVIAEAAGRGRR